ncbi:DUF1127 domain-containing protein [Roseivivax sediminis]|uniref:Uncharacterized conserved protein YjiS, DUF1127 family n=1 Tax=Roseivivax sediminis TaxID=936889 RepID=A0A1I1US31_9RHOB|nr:DUF1127 domain-containing protein [Roseivivax sediminis]SFD73611.1 Uncharacterized conserved protein YjiS, DUF1127 family [Roseivivax sediminis]
MSTVHTARPASLDVAGQIGSLFVSAVNSAVSFRDARRTQKALSKLTDRELDDIGLTRADISRIARR